MGENLSKKRRSQQQRGEEERLTTDKEKIMGEARIGFA